MKTLHQKKHETTSLKPICLLKQLYSERILQPANQDEIDGPPLPIGTWDFLKPILQICSDKSCQSGFYTLIIGYGPPARMPLTTGRLWTMFSRESPYCGRGPHLNYNLLCLGGHVSRSNQLFHVWFPPAVDHFIKWLNITRIVAPQGERSFFWANLGTSSGQFVSTESASLRMTKPFWEKQLKNPCHPSSAPGIQGFICRVGLWVGNYLHIILNRTFVYLYDCDMIHMLSLCKKSIQRRTCIYIYTVNQKNMYI